MTVIAILQGSWGCHCQLNSETRLSSKVSC